MSDERLGVIAATLLCKRNHLSPEGRPAFIMGWDAAYLNFLDQFENITKSETMQELERQYPGALKLIEVVTSSLVDDARKYGFSTEKSEAMMRELMRGIFDEGAQG